MTIWRYGDDVNTDQLFPGKYTYTCSTPEEIRPHLLEDLDPRFSEGVREGDIILAGRNFGCGSSREQPVVGFRSVGIAAIIAASFARIFYRAAINQGLLLIESVEVAQSWSEGEEITIDLKEGDIRSGDRVYRIPPLPAMLLAIRDAGGLLPAVRARLAEEREWKR
ncbi:3-isopropylmalate dehydratase [Gemmatimonadota bacterium]